MQLFSYCNLSIPPKTFESLFNTVLGQDGLIFDDVGWWSGFNKGCDIVHGVDIGIGKIVEGVGTKKQVAPDHGDPTGSTIIVVEGENIP